MTFPTIEDITETTHVGETNHVINYPATVDAGDLLICVFTCDDDEATVTFPNEGTDWHTIYKEDAGPQGPTLAVAWREAVGDEGGGTFTIVTPTSEGSCTYLFRISGAEDPDTQPPEVSASASGSSVNPNSLSLTPTGGSKDYLFISAEGNDDDDDTTGWPSNMADNNVFSQVATVTLGIATEEVTNSVFDPAQFTIAATETWEAVTIAVHPVEVTVYDIYITSAVAASGAMSPEQTLNVNITSVIVASGAMSPEQTLNLNQVAGVSPGDAIGLQQVLSLSPVGSVLAETSYLFPIERVTVDFPEVIINTSGLVGEQAIHTVPTGKKCRVKELTIYHDGTEKTVVQLLVGTEVKLRVTIPPQSERVWSSALGRVFTAGQVIKVQGSSVVNGDTYISGSGLETISV